MYNLFRMPKPSYIITAFHPKDAEFFNVFKIIYYEIYMNFKYHPTFRNTGKRKTLGQKNAALFWFRDYFKCMANYNYANKNLLKAFIVE